MANLGLTSIIVAVVLTEASQADAYCNSVEVEDAYKIEVNGFYTELTDLNCGTNRKIFQKGQMFLYHNNYYWMISEYDFCLGEEDSLVWARVRDSAASPEYIRKDWKERAEHGWYTSTDLEVYCYNEMSSSGLSTATIVGITLGSIFGGVVVISIVTGLVKSYKSRAATRQAMQASSATTGSVSNSNSTPQPHATCTSESYQPPAYEPPEYINPHFEPDGPGHAGVQPTAPVYDEMRHEDFHPPPSYEDAINDQKQIYTISKMEPPPLYNTAYPSDANHAGQGLSAYPPSENQSFYPHSSTGDAELSTESAMFQSDSAPEHL